MVKVNLKFLIIDCFRFNEHVTHLDLYSTLRLIKLLKPKKSILTNLDVGLDYEYLKKISSDKTLIIFDTIRPEYFKNIFKNIDIMQSNQKTVHKSKRIIYQKD